MKLTTDLKQELLQKVADDEFGGDVEAMLLHYVTDSVVPGICTTCKGIEQSCEPDAEGNTCEECSTDTVISIIELAL